MPDETVQSGVTPAPSHSPGEPAAWIALLRGINVRGTRNLPMAALAQVLAASGLTSVKTYIQTGNIVFRHPESDASRLSALVTRAIGDHFGLEPAIFVFRHSVPRRCAAKYRPQPSETITGTGRTIPSRWGHCLPSRPEWLRSVPHRRCLGKNPWRQCHRPQLANHHGFGCTSQR